ncbi:MAG TPA: ATP-binding protein [Acidimicrobiia bacterium]
MNRFRLSAKLALAVIPIGIVALLAAGFLANSFLKDSSAQSESARVAIVTAGALETLDAVWDEQTQARQLYVFFDANAGSAYSASVEQSDAAIDRLSSSISALANATTGLSNEVALSAADQVEGISAALDRIRSIDSPTTSDVANYDDIAEGVLSLIPKFSSLVSDRDQARALSTAYFLAEGGQVSLEQEQLVEEFQASAFPTSSATATSNARNNLQATLEILERDFASWGLRASQTANADNEVVQQFAEPMPVDIDTFPTERNDEILGLSVGFSQNVAAQSSANAAQSEREAYLVAGVAAIVLLLALWGAYSVIRSIVQRVRGVTEAATQVTEVDLPNLVEALQNPTGAAPVLQPTVIEAAGSDEVGELAESFVALHTTLIEVAGQQMEILRRGVSEIFVTLARRNRSLVDRQLALLDELESREEDAETLGGYYKLDHLATRMRRNAESLLVLAGSEPTRVWDDPLDVSEIIRAALGEVDEYQRVDIMALEPALVSGRAVADIAHLMSELLDNGTQYSSPSDRVRVAGLFDPDGYMLTVSDSGIGITDAKRAELNALLEAPPVLGLALQPTLGMYVVARLAARHRVKVQLIAGSPGLTIRVLLPKDLIEPAKAKKEPKVVEGSGSVTLTDTIPFTPEPVVTHGGVRSGHSYANTSEAPATEQSEKVVQNGTSTLPGSIVGKHEHPGRQKGSRSTPDETFAVAAFGAEDSTGDMEPEGLVRRVPGDTLRSNQDEFEAVAPEIEAIDRVEMDDDSPWWTKDVVNPGAKPEESRSLWDEVEPAPSEVEPAATAFEPADPDVEPAESDDGLALPASEPATPKVPTKFAPARNDTTTKPKKEKVPVAPVAAVSGSGLPVRTPGVSFHDEDDGGASSAASESGAIGIKSALTSFAGGRNAADSEFQNEDDGDGADG